MIEINSFDGYILNIYMYYKYGRIQYLIGFLIQNKSKRWFAWSFYWDNFIIEHKYFFKRAYKSFWLMSNKIIEFVVGLKFLLLKV